MITPSFSATATERVLPRLALNFTVPTLDPRVTLTRALDTATRVNSSGFIETVLANNPRFDYDPVTLACRGLLIEELRTNLSLQSAAFDNTSYWSRSNLAAVSADATASPEGVQNADKIVENTANALHGISTLTAVAVSAGASITLSVYAKAGERTWIALYDGIAGRGKFFNLTNGTIGGNLIAAPVSAAISPSANGFYRCSIVVTAAATTSLSVFLSPDGTTFSYTGDGSSGAFLYGSQIEAGAFATSYIPTTTTSLTRNADVVSMTGTNFTSWYNATEGAFVTVADTLSTTGHIISADNGASERIYQLATVGGSVSSNIVSGGVNTFSQSLGSVVSGTAFKTAIAYKSNNANSAVNTTAGATDTTVTVPSIVQLRIGTNVGGVYLNGHVASILYYPQRLIDAELQAFTK